MKEQIIKLNKKATWVRKKTFDIFVNAGSGHIAPCFSCVDILVALYYSGILDVNPRNPKWANRDRFILSKGHAAAALYVVLADLGFFSKLELLTFTCDKTRLGAHPTEDIPGVEASTGSLGHGLSIGTGFALAAKMDKKKYRTFVLMGDGECHEGNAWEAAMFAAHHHLNNLVVIIDHNGLSATDFLKNSLNVEPLKDKWESFGWEAKIVSGHNFELLLETMNGLDNRKTIKPLAIIAKTVKGRGVSFMENNPLWHYRVPRGQELRMARKELSLGSF